MKKCVVITVSFILISGCFSGNICAGITNEEREALITLYNSTDGKNWDNSANWLGPAGTECTWHGVVCDPEQNNVIWLDLHENQLTGTIPTELATLSNVTGLSLYDNQLTGSIPAELATLSKTEYLYLDLNLLTGPIPAELGKLSNLKELRQQLPERNNST